MKRDYSVYQYSEIERYHGRRANTSQIRFDFFVNHCLVHEGYRMFQIRVDSYNEEIILWDDILADEARRGFTDSTEPPLTEEGQAIREQAYQQNQEDWEQLSSRYQISRSDFNETAERLYDDYPDKEEAPLNNVLSGTLIELQYGEGILDFIYADFDTAYQEAIEFPLFLHSLRQAMLTAKSLTEETAPKSPPTKAIDQLDVVIQEYYAFENTMQLIRPIAYTSLYTAICPPLFEHPNQPLKAMQQYRTYLKLLQQEYSELLEFCYDEDFFPEVLGSLHPAERYALYRRAKGWPVTSNRKEQFSIVGNLRSIGTEMPYGKPVEEVVAQIQQTIEFGEQHKAFLEKYGMEEKALEGYLRFPHFVRADYEFRTTADILELEFTKMLEQDVRFRKCKRCGKYFIMKGNYDTRFCDRTASGETRSCQTLAAQEAYKQKADQDPALGIYSKYYRRYVARVKVGKITEDALKKWKYQAMTKRDACSSGEITPEEYIAWMEGCFPNRRKKT